MFLFPNLYLKVGLRSRRRSRPRPVLGDLVKLIRDPDDNPADFRLVSTLLLVASALYIVPQVYGMEAADQAYLGDLPRS